MGARKRDWTAILLVAPAAAVFLALLVLPMIVVLVLSLGDRAEAGGYQAALTLAQYANLPARWTAFKNTLVIAPTGTLICLVIAYPLAYFLAFSTRSATKLLLLILVVAPFWTSALIRVLCLDLILGGKDVPALLANLGFDDIRLIDAPFAVIVDIVYAYLPLMVFPSMWNDERLLEASADLYATPVSSFLQVTLPLSAPGVVTGCMLVFILLMGGLPDPGAARRRQGLLRRRCAGRPLPAVAQLAVRRRLRRGPGRHHAGHRHALHAVHPGRAAPCATSR